MGIYFQKAHISSSGAGENITKLPLDVPFIHFNGKSLDFYARLGQTYPFAKAPCGGKAGPVTFYTGEPNQSDYQPYGQDNDQCTDLVNDYGSSLMVNTNKVEFEANLSTAEEASKRRMRRLAELERRD